MYIHVHAANMHNDDFFPVNNVCIQLTHPPCAHCSSPSAASPTPAYRQVLVSQKNVVLVWRGLVGIVAVQNHTYGLLCVVSADIPRPGSADRQVHVREHSGGRLAALRPQGVLTG